MGTVWKTVKKMSGPVKNSQIPNLKHGNLTFDTNSAKADILADVFSGVSSTSNYSNTFQSHKQIFEFDHRNYLHGLQGPLDDSGSFASDEINDLNSDFRMHELLSSVGHCKLNSSPGFDGISNVIIKQIPIVCLAVLLLIFNSMWGGGVLPSDW